MKAEDFVQSPGRLVAISGGHAFVPDPLPPAITWDASLANAYGAAREAIGRLDEAIGYYRKALAIDPNFVLAREYLGEGYVAGGRIDLAKAELNEIARRCGTTCEEYQELAEHIEQAM